MESIGLDFERFRFVDPHAEERIRASVRLHGQLSPALVGRVEDRLILVDGYKRFRALRSEGVEQLRVCKVDHSLRALKVMILSVNHEESVCREIEEALVVWSLHREDGLQQQEIAMLCNRHKSWVCRRIAVLEKLNEEVIEQVRLGLLPISIAWELLRLQRCNQPSALQTIRTHRLGCRQTHLLVQGLLSRPAWQQQQLLHDPDPVLGISKRSGVDCGLFSVSVNGLLRQLEALEEDMRLQGMGSLSREQCLTTGNMLTGVRDRCAVLHNTIMHGLEGML